MNEIWNLVFLENTVKSYVTVAVTILIIFLLQRLISKYIAIFLFRLLRMVFPSLEKESFVNLLVKPIKTYLVVVTTILAIGSLKFPSQLNFTLYKTTLSSVLHSIAQLILVYAFVKLVISVIEFIAEIFMRRAKTTVSTKDDQLISFFKDFLKALVVLIGIFMVFKFVFNYPISNLVTALSIVGAALSLAAKESLENVIASFIIFIDDPFEIGDVVKVQNIGGTVEKIGLRSTRIRTDQKTIVSVPNKVMVDSIMDNQSMRNQMRGLVIYDVPYILPVDQLEEIIAKVKSFLENNEQISSSSVFVTDIIDYKVKIHVEYLTNLMPAADFNQLKNNVNLYLIRAFQNNNEKEKAN